MYKNFQQIFQNIKNNLQLKTIVRQSFKLIDNNASASIRGRFIYLELKNMEAKKTVYKFPSIWLRDNCQCAECFHTVSHSRIMNWQTMNHNIAPKSVSLDEQLKIIWNDEHSSQFDLNWLKARNFSEENQESYLNEIYRPKPRFWSKVEFNKIVESFEFNDILRTKDGLRAWLHSLSVNGVAMINDAPSTEDTCRRIADQIGFIKKTHYGEEFIVRAKEGTNNVAYLSAPLQIHTDLPYYEYKPGVNLLHCLVQSSSPGAFNLLVDGFYVANRMRREYPDFYRILTETIVNWSDYGQEDGFEFRKVYRAPVICLDYDGSFKRINHSVPQRDSYFSIAPDAADKWYEAMIQFVQLLHDEAVEFKTKPGDILTFSNIRMLHGRTGYTDIDGNTRHLVGAYIDWDEIYSRLRVLSPESS